MESGYKSKREAFEGIAKEAKGGFGILLGDVYYTEEIIKDMASRDVDTWKHYYCCLPNPWTGCPWEEGYIHLVPNWEWWLEKMQEFNSLCDSGEIEFVKDFQIDRYLRGYSNTHEYREHWLDDHDIFWCDETDDFDFPNDYDMFMARHEKNKNHIRKDKFSIIIPHYNTPQKLVRMLDSLKRQHSDYPEPEIIVVDDGSDSDLSWVMNYNVTLIRQNNGGVSKARNVGLRACTGKYVAFLDADDYVEPDYLHTMYQIMRTGKFDYALFPFIVELTGCVSWPRQELIGNSAVWSWAFTWDCINGEMFNEKMQVAEDIDWLSRVVTPEKRRFEPRKPIYHYDWNGNPNSLCKRYNRGEITKEFIK